MPDVDRPPWFPPDRRERLIVLDARRRFWLGLRDRTMSPIRASIANGRATAFEAAIRARIAGASVEGA